MEKKRFYTPAGTRIQPTYQRKIKNGKIELVKTGETNIYEKIQSYADMCDITKILEKCTRGDYSGLYANLKTTKAQYGDISNIPKNINEMHQRTLDAKQDFYSLPAELRKEFDMDFNKFADEMMNGTADAKIKKFFKIKEKPVEQLPGQMTMEKYQQTVQQPTQTVSGGYVQQTTTGGIN